MISLKPALLARYRDIVLLLTRHSGSKLVQSSVLEELSLEVAEDTGRGDTGPERLAADLEELGPTFVKLGQLLSTRPDLLPQPYLDALTRLQDDVGPFSFEEVEEIVVRELGVRISKAFSSFEERPLAAASLAQVHRATLRDGRDVVVKVQRPGIREQIATDVEALLELSRLLHRRSETARRYQLLSVAEEFRDTLARELDFQREAANLEQFRESLARFPELEIPQPHPDYCSPKILTMDFVDGTKIDQLNPVVHTDLDGSRLTESLFRAYLYQVLVLGTFHADPHPGNVLLTREHKIGLLDLGMTGHVAPDLQDRLVRLLLALSDGRGDEVARIALEMAERTDDCDEESFGRRIGTLVAIHADSKIEEVKTGRLLLQVCREAAEHGVLLPPTLSLLGKTLLHLDQVALALDPEFDPQAAIHRYADELMSQRMKRQATPTNLLTTLLETKEFAENLPARANRILELAAANQLRVEIDAFDEKNLLASIEKVANRITAGLVLAALIIGASMLMEIETRFTLFGYPGLAILFFLLAAGGGLWLVFSILVRKRGGGI